MAYRTFVDPKGVTWQVWEVRPSTVERRVGDRRTRAAPYAGAERRSGTDRRMKVEQRVSLGPELAQGWLAFHTSGEKRRYAPIPPEWESMSSAELSELCDRAHVVSLGGPPRDGDGNVRRSA